jgi:hypothetical protein
LCGAVIFATAHEEKDKPAEGAECGKTIYIGTQLRGSQARTTSDDRAAKGRISKPFE